MRNFDLHMHSNYSKDGELTPTQLIQIAKEKNLACVALCDHDGVQGIDEMLKAGESAGVQVIPGIEFTTLFNDDIECHLLGYGFDYKSEYFQNITATVNQLMEDAFHTRVVKLESQYPIKIDEAQVIKDANGENPWFLMCQRIFTNPEYASIEDFKDYIPGGKRCDPAPVNFFWDKCQKGSPLYVRVEYPSFKESVQKIHEAGGIAVLAHPFKTFYQNEELLQLAIDCGIDGIEAYSNYHTEEQNEYYAAYAKEKGLLITCGSDFHGKHKPSIQMGTYGYENQEEKEKLLQSFLTKLDKQ